MILLKNIITPHKSKLAAFIVAATGLTTPQAGVRAAVIDATWNAGDGNWSAASNWDPAVVPNNNANTYNVFIAGNTANDPVTVQLDLSVLIDTLFIQTGDTLNVAGGFELGIAGGAINNQGLIVVNPAATNAPTSLQTDGNLSLDGTGQIRLARFATNPAQIIGTDSADLITHGVGHTIFGVGELAVGMNNLGIIRADATAGTGNELRIRDFNLQNSGLLEALSGSTLRLQNLTLTQTGTGETVARDGGTVELSNATVIGNSLVGEGTGLFTATNSSRLENVTLDGLLNLPASQALEVTGTLTNNGLLVVNSTGGSNTTTFRADGDLSLDGSGELRLRRYIASNPATITAADPDDLITHGADHLIRGAGVIEARIENLGTIRADGSVAATGSELRLRNRDLTSQGLLEAVTNSTLRLENLTATQTAAGETVARGGGTVELVNATLQGPGTLRSETGGDVRLQSSVIEGGVVLIEPSAQFHSLGASSIKDSQVSNEGTMNLESGSTLDFDLSQNLVNDGLIVVNRTGGSNTTTFRADGDLSLDGSGELRLRRYIASNPATITAADPDYLITHGADHLIRGAGVIETRLDNLGTIRADGSVAATGSELRIRNRDLANQGLMEAANNSTLRFENLTLTQTGAGETIARDGGEVELSNTTVVGNSLIGEGTGLFTATNNSRLENVILDGLLHVPGSHTLEVFDTLSNNGLLVVNPTGTSSTSTFRAEGDLSLNGPGELRLRRFSTSTPARIVSADPDDVLTHGADHLIRGAGIIETRLENLGTIRADSSVAATGSELRLRNRDLTNQGLMEAVANSTLRLENLTATQTAGETVARDGGTVELVNATLQGPGTFRSETGGDVRLQSSVIEGGVVFIEPGAQFHVLGTSSIKDSQVSNEGTGNLEAGSTLGLDFAQDLVNNGLIVVNRTGTTSTTTFRADGDLSIDGTGELRLRRFSVSTPARIISADPDDLLTHGADHLIQGAGIIETRIDNLGIIRADGSVAATGSELRLRNRDLTNQGLLEAAHNSTLRFENLTLTQTGTGETVARNGAEVELSNTTVVGNSLVGEGTGLFTATNNSRVENVTLDGRLNLPAGQTLEVFETLTNDGHIVVNPTGTTSTTTLRADGDLAFDGEGELLLRRYSLSTSSRIINTQPDAVLTHGAGHTMRGVGVIGMEVENFGTLRADASVGFGGELHVGPVSNSGLVMVEEASTLVLNGGPLAQTSTGTLAGSGTVSGNVFGGTVSPGNSIGTLSVIGDVFMQNGTLEIELGATGEGDFLNVSGIFDLSGEPMLAISGGVLNETYTIAFFAQRTGVFGSVTPGYLVDYNATEIFVTVIPEPSQFVMTALPLAYLLYRRFSRHRRIKSL